MKTIHVVTEAETGAILGAFSNFGRASDFASGEQNGASIHEVAVNNADKPVIRTWELKKSD